MDDPWVLRIARAVRDAGGRALLVGGLVRDALLAGATPEARDVDLEVYGVGAERLGALLREIGPVSAVGAAFTVYKAGDIDGIKGGLVVQYRWSGMCGLNAAHQPRAPRPPAWTRRLPRVG